MRHPKKRTPWLFAKRGGGLSFPLRVGRRLKNLWNVNWADLSYIHQQVWAHDHLL